MAPRIAAVEQRTAMPPPKAAAPFYLTPAWRNLMQHLMAVRGRVCQACGRTNCRIFGDHIRELQDGGQALDPGNVRLLCGSCHTAKTAAARATRARQDHGP